VIYTVTLTQAILDEVIGLSVDYNSTIYAGQTCPGANCASTTVDGETVHYCPANHSLHAIGFWYYSADMVMTSLGFIAAEREWVTLTSAGFDANPNL
jgi:hypothetical protein